MVAGSMSVTIALDAALLEQARAAADGEGLSLEAWIAHAVCEKLAAAATLPRQPEGEPPVRTPYVEAAITTRSTHSSAG